MSMKMDIIDHVQRFYGNVAGVTVSEATTIDELEIDSLDRTELVIHVERTFGVVIPDERWDACATVGLMIDAAWKAKS